MTVTLPALYAVLVLGAAFPEPPRARVALVGLAPCALAVASYAVEPGSGDLPVIAGAARASSALFFTVNTGLLLLGAALAAAVALAVLRDRPRSPRGLALLAGSGLVLWRVAGLAGPSGAVRSVLAGAAAALLGAGVGTVLLWLRRSTRSSPSPVGWPGLGGSLPVAFALGLGALAVVAGSRVGLVFLGLGVAAVADFLGRRAIGQGRVPWLPAVALALVPIWWLMTTIAGAVGLGVANLADVPFSPRAEILIALPLALVAWSCLGLWPVQRLLPAGLLAPLGLALWLRVARPAVPEGLEHWQALLFPLGVLGVWGGALTGSSVAALNALAFVALASGAPGSAVGAVLLAVSALALAVAQRPGGERAGGTVVERLAWVIAALGLPFVLEAGFRAQVTYTLAAAAGAAATFWLGLTPEPGERHHSDRFVPAEVA